MDYALAIAALSGDREELEKLIDRTLFRLKPRPTRLLIYDNGRKAEAELALAERTLPTASVPFVIVAGEKRRLSDEAAFGRLWRMIGAQTCPFVLMQTDDFQLTRSVNVPDVAYVLERERKLQAIRFSSSTPHKKLTADTRRGTGTVAWFVSSGTDVDLTAGPVMIRPALAKSFPWPKRGGSTELEDGIRSSLPGSIFGTWGVGDAWAELT